MTAGLARCTVRLTITPHSLETTMNRTTFPAGSLFNSLADVNAVCSGSYQDALREARRDCGRGTYVSRGKSLIALRDSDVVAGEAESWLWDGTLKGLLAAIDEARFGDKADTLVVQGGINYAASPRDYADCAYDPWVGEWSVTVWRKPAA